MCLSRSRFCEETRTPHLWRFLSIRKALCLSAVNGAWRLLSFRLPSANHHWLLRQRRKSPLCSLAPMEIRILCYNYRKKIKAIIRYGYLSYGTNIILLDKGIKGLPRSIKAKRHFGLEFKLYRKFFTAFQCDDEIIVSILFYGMAYGEIFTKPFQIMS